MTLGILILARSTDLTSFTLTIGCAFAKTSMEEEIICAP
ncbi:hypothetical protein yaldo0001_19240 [Yersinia aldovae ATCC 35236]|nr:hypothetical protein yaldo0001_19240 [Yersinia aldovae ATCC 35236]